MNPFLCTHLIITLMYYTLPSEKKIIFVVILSVQTKEKSICRSVFFEVIIDFQYSSLPTYHQLSIFDNGENILNYN